MRSVSATILTAALLGGCAGALHAQLPSLGPLVFEEGSPLQRVAMTPVVEGADVTPRGRIQADLWLGYSNIFEQDSADSHELFIDLERLVTTVTVRYGVTARVEVGGRLAWETTGGGVLDSFIVGWHNRLGLGNANRERYPEGRYAQRLIDADGKLLLDVPRRTFGLEDVRLFAKAQVAGAIGSDRALSVRGVVRIPTHDNRVGRERADLALLVLGRARWGGYHLHGVLGGSTLRASQDLDGVLADAWWLATLGVERPLTHRLSALVQMAVATSKIRGFDHRELDGPSSSLVFGLAGLLGESWRWEASFQEDLPPDTPSVDFTLGLGLRRTF